MAISSAMYAAVTGLSALSTGMQTISNNIANVNTVGFKTGRTNYEDLISQSYASGGRTSQIGRGVKVASIQSMFTQGAFMSSAQDTDLAIAGEGFFSVRNSITGAINYTRAGNFTVSKDGYMEDPSGNIVQGWQMSIPKPGAEAVKIGTPEDIKITVLNAPPLATSQIKLAVNLDADDEPAYYYGEYELAESYAHQVAEPVALSAQNAAALATWDTGLDTAVTYNDTTGLVQPSTSPHGELFNEYFVTLYNETYGTSFTRADLASLEVLSSTAVDPDRSLGQMTEYDFNYLVTAVESTCQAEAEAQGRTAYSQTYANVYDATYSAVKSRLADWQLEGKGFAEAWNATESPYIDSENYTHAEPIIIYDSLGSEHQLMVYFQKNPHMENIWDYVITCDPLEDARKDADNSLLFSQAASFSGLIQKGKLTFSTDGVIKDIEAQNLDLSQTRLATASEPTYASAATAPLRNAVIGGYYTGSPEINPFTGRYETSDRSYSLAWGQEEPAGSGTWADASGLTWTDSTGQTGFISLSNFSHPGPYEFGSGLTLTFSQSDLPLSYGLAGQDALYLEARSEQIAWTNQSPNQAGYFDFETAFVQSASMALHPPYPEGLPTVIQTIALDLGARNPGGAADGWILDSICTTQYATSYSTVYNSQDGFPPGSLQRVSIGEDGVVTGVYSNGRHQALYQIGLTTFMNPWGLSKLGDNLFQATLYSGSGVLNEPGYGGAGTVLANYLEQSNVDLSEEIVNMIVTQRGFQANSKVITTTDSMLSEVIEMKR